VSDFSSAAQHSTVTPAIITSQKVRSTKSVDLLTCAYVETIYKITLSYQGESVSQAGQNSCSFDILLFVKSTLRQAQDRQGF